MDIVALTRQLVDIESITGNEATVGHFLEQELRKLGYESRRMPVEGDRANVYATSPQEPNPSVVFSTHMDTVPPFIPSSEDDQKIYGRGSCDAKGIIATQIAAAERLKREGIHVGLLFLVGEARDLRSSRQPGSSRVHAGNSRRPPTYLRRTADDDRGVYNRHPRAQQLGAANPHRPGINPCGAYRRRVRGKAAVDRGGGVVLQA